MDKYTTALHLWTKSQKMGVGWAARFWDNRKHPHTKMLFILSLPTYLLNIILFTTQTLSQIKSQEFISLIQKYFITSPLIKGIQDFVKCYIKSWVHLDLWPNMLFGGLQPIMEIYFPYELVLVFGSADC